MNISKKLRQLMKVVLVVFMSLTAIVTDGLVKAENQYLSTDKTSYAYGEPVMVTVTGYPLATDGNKTWVGLYPIDEDYTSGKDTTSWYYVTVSEPVNLLDPKTYVGNDNGNVNSQDKIDAGGQFYVVLYGTDESTIIGDPIIITLEANPNPPVPTNSLETDKDVYEVGEPIMVTASTDISGAWVGLYDWNTSIHDKSVAWYYVSDYQGVAENLLAHSNNKEGFPVDNLPTGTYRVELLYENADKVYTEILSPIIITIESNIPEEIHVDKEDDGFKYHQYKYSEQVLVTATSPDSAASVRLCDESPSAEYGYDNGYYVSYKLNEYENPVDILALAIEKGVKPEAGKQYRIYLVNGDGSWVNQARCELLVTYDDEDVDWNLSEDKTSATITFKRVDDETKTKIYDAVLGEKTVKKAATCTETGIDEYPVSFRFGEEPLITVKDTVSFTGIIEDITAVLGHAWGEWEVITPATEETPGLERRVCKNDSSHFEEREIPVLSHVHNPVLVEAKAATCTEDGNIRYYTCTCGKYFRDEACTEELNAEDVVIKAIGHKTGDWVYDEQNHKHYKVCENCGAKVDEADCVFTKRIANNIVTYTCSICGHGYQEILVATDKEVYEYEDPIYVTINGYDVPENSTGYVWVGLYQKGATPIDTNPSIYFYDNNGYDLSKPVNIKATDNSSGKMIDYETGGEYDVVLMYQSADKNWYNVVSRKTITIKPSTIQDNITVDKEGDGNEYHQYKYSEQVLVTATSPNPKASVRLCDAVASDPYGFDKGYYVSYNLSDHDGPVDILALAIEEGFKPEAGKQYRIYLISPKSSNSNDWVKQAKVELLVTYYDDAEHIEWKLSEDHTTATITLKRVDNEKKTETFNATVGTASTKVAPTCTETGTDVYPLSFEFNDSNKLITVNDKTKFTENYEVETAALGHDWGKWHVDPNDNTQEICECKRCDATQTRPYVPCEHVFPLTHVEAKAATCTENGNIEYWQCSNCERVFADAEGKDEINIESTVIAALGHNYGNLIFDEEAHNHYYECSRCHDRIVEECDFEDSYVECTVKHTCTECGGSYEEVFFWVDKTEFKQFEPIIVHVNLDLLKKYRDLDKDHAWVGLYGDGITPADNNSTRWHYVKNMGKPEDGFDMLEILNTPDEGGSGSTNGYNDVLTQAGNLHLYLFRDNGFTKIAHIAIKLTEDSLPTGDIEFEFYGKKPTMEEHFDFVLPIENKVEFKATVDGNPYGAWVGIYEGEFDKDYDFHSLQSITYWYIRNCNGEHRSINDYIKKPGKYTLAVFGTGAWDDLRELVTITVSKKIDTEEITIRPTCTEPGNKKITYVDGTYENVQIPALGHDWGEWVYDGEEAKTHTRTCKHDASHKETVNCEFDEGVVDDDVTTYTCKECHGQYTYTRVASDAPLFRSSGANRYLTALTAADVFMEKTHKSELDVVVLACGSNFADALAGSYLAAVKNAPIILIDDNEKAPTVEKYLKEHVAKGGLIYILGGDKAVAPKFESSLKKAGFTVKRLSGSNRYGTNLEILKEAGIQGNAILVSTGANFADSLSASASGLPVLLVKDKLTAEQKDFLSNYSGKKIYILGGTNAVNKTIEGEMGEYGTVKRIRGNTRYETSTKIAEQFFAKADSVVIAVGDNFPDGLCGGALAFQVGAPVILVKDGKADNAKKFVKDHNIEKGIILGGTNALKDTLINEIFGRDPKTPVEVYVKK